jgi:hypothetical protein
LFEHCREKGIAGSGFRLFRRDCKAQMAITIRNVDELLRDHPAGHHASTMCALVLAMLDPSRARHA